MGKVKQLFIGVLSTIFVLSLVSPLCCHTNWSELFAHAHSSSAHHHTHDDDSNSGCDNHLVKNLSKPDRFSADPNQSVSSAGILFFDTFRKRIPKVRQESSFRLIFFNKAGPPLYLLHSVFLN